MNASVSALHKTYYANKTVIVTGGAGTLGSQLVGRLVALGAQVRVLDNLSTGRIDRLGALAAHISFMPSCITNKAISSKILNGASHLFHLAHAPHTASAAECERINIDGTTTLYQAAAAAGLKHVVFAPPYQEDGSPYTQSIETAEQRGVALAEQANISVANLRLIEPHAPTDDILTALLHAGLCIPLRGHTVAIGGDDDARLSRLLAYRPTK